MLTQKSNQFVLPMIVVVIAVAILAVIVVQTIAGQISSASLSQTTSNVQSVASVTSEEDSMTAEVLKFNQQETGLTQNWNIFQDSLNYADYPSIAAANRDTAQFLTTNEQATGLDSNWSIFQDSLNYADYPDHKSSAIPPYDEDGDGLY